MSNLSTKTTVLGALGFSALGLASYSLFRSASWLNRKRAASTTASASTAATTSSSTPLPTQASLVGPVVDEAACQGPRPTFKVACVQLSVGADKAKNMQTAADAVKRAAAQGAKLVVLPEMFNCPYANSSFPVYAEEVPESIQAANAEQHPTFVALSQVAKECQVYLVGGSIPERENDQLFNTCLIFSPQGQLITKHRKVHLFDINIPGRQVFKESDTLTPGNQVTVFDTDLGCKIGVGICYDIRFAEYAMAAANQGAELLIYPGAFNITTGPLHWELLQRGRAVDNQLYVATASPSLDPDFSYKAWGHSTIVGPFGNVLATCDNTDAIVMSDINLNWVSEVRRRIPIRDQKRADLYSLPTVVKH